MLTHDSQATPGNTVRIGNEEVLIVDSVPSTRGALLVVRPSADSLVHVLVYQGDLIDSEDVDHVAGPVSGEGQSANDAAQAATDARVANLEAKFAQVQAENDRLRSESGAVPVADAQVVDETTDPTGATSTPGEAPSEPSPAPQVVQEG
jgi:hypothetical protein